MSNLATRCADSSQLDSSDVTKAAADLPVEWGTLPTANGDSEDGEAAIESATVDKHAHVNTGAELEFHELCLIFPQADGRTLSDMAEDITKNGLKAPIILFEGKILDGRNRYLACRLAGVEPRYKQYTEDEPLQHVISKNLHRRHLSESQRAVVADDVYQRLQGTDHSITREQAAEQFNVSRRSVQTASRVREEAPEGIKQAVLAGTKSLHAADKDCANLHKADLSETKPNAMTTGKKTMSKAVAEIREQKQTEANVKPSLFAQAIADGVHTGKKFRKKVGELTKLIDQCVITVPLVEYLGVCVAIESLEQVIECSKSVPKMIPPKDLEKRLASLQAEKQDLHTEISEVIIFGRDTYPKWIDPLKKEAATDEEKALIKSVEKHFEETWSNVRSDLAQSKNAHFEVLEVNTKEVAASTFTEEFDFMLGDVVF